jgi:hypothetical protein
MRADGMGLKSVLVVTAVLLVAFAILFTAQRYVMGQSDEFVDAQKMRTIYTAIYMYEVSHDDVPPASLLTIQRDLGEDDVKVLQSRNDPWTASPEGKSKTSFPIDPACPHVKGETPIRISFSYMPIWARLGGVKVKSWQKEDAGVKAGILASWWYGSIDNQNLDGRNCTGPVVRINMDGSVYRLDHRSDSSSLTADDLFFRR